MSRITAHFTKWSVGNGVYTNVNATSLEDHGSGMMVHVFYGAATWMVRYKPGTGQTRSTLHPGWIEPAPGSPNDIAKHTRP